MAHLYEDNYSPLENITYTNVINEILEVMKTKRGITVDNRRGNLIKGIPEISFYVANNLMNKQISEVMGLKLDNNSFTVTTNFLDIKREEDSVYTLENALRESLDNLSIYPTRLKYHNNKFNDRYFNIGVRGNFEDFTTKMASMKYSPEKDFNKKYLSQEMVSISFNNSNMRDEIKESLISLFTDDIDDELEKRASLQKINNPDFLIKRLENFINSFKHGAIKRTVEGSLYMNFVKDLLEEQKDKFSSQELNSFESFSNYVNRFDLLEEFIQKALIEGYDEDYVIEYDNSKLDILHKLRMEDIYSFLPLIGRLTPPIINSSDTSNHNEFDNFGISLKRDGKVTTEGEKSVFNYDINLLNQYVDGKKKLCLSNKKMAYGSEFIKALLLKYFIVGLNNKDYDPIKELTIDLQNAKNNMLTCDSKIRQEMKSILNAVNINIRYIEETLRDIKNLITKYMDLNYLDFEKTYTRKFAVLNSILPENILEFDENEDMNILNVDGYHTNLVKYTGLIDENTSSDYYVYSHDYKITISTKSIEKLNNIQDINLTHDFEDIISTNFIFVPVDKNNNKLTERIKQATEGLDKEFEDILNKERDLLLENKNGYPNIYLEYSDFVFKSDKFQYYYETAYHLISFTIINILCDKLSTERKEFLKKFGPEVDRKIYVLISQILEENLGRDKKYSESLNKEQKKEAIKEDDDKYLYKDGYSKSQNYIRALRKSIAHNLSQRYTSSSQGFDLKYTGEKIKYGSMQGRDTSIYKTGNAVSSAYNEIPKICTLRKELNYLKKTAMILVTSRAQEFVEVKDEKGRKVKFSNSIVHGKVVTFDEIKDTKKVRICKREEFADFNVYDKNVHKKSDELRNIVAKLRNDGYKNILYIAKTPYTSSMFEEKDGVKMYFMNESIIKDMMGDFKDINLIPLYVGSTNIHQNSNNKEENIIYVSGTSSIVDDTDNKYEGIIPLIQFYSGNIVNKEADTYYRQMLIYSSIKGVYSEEFLSSMNRYDLYNDKNLLLEIAHLITAYHLYKYEKAPANKASDNEIIIKNNPYNDLLGDKSVSKIAVSRYKIDIGKQTVINISTNRYALTTFLFKTLNKNN